MQAFLSGIATVISGSNLLFMVLGVTVGIIFGAIPGLNSTMAIALFLPITFGMNMFSSVCLLIGLYIGAVSGGLISAIILNIPGTSNSICTTFDGHPMAKQGLAGKALAAGIIYSFVGTAFSISILIFVAPILSKWAVQLTPYDYFALIF